MKDLSKEEIEEKIASMSKEELEEYAMGDGLPQLSEEEMEELAKSQKEFTEYMTEYAEYIDKQNEGIKEANKIELEGKYANATIFIDEVEDTAIEQIRTMLDTPHFKGSTIKVMPDVHAGYGSVIGLTAKNPPIVPSIVGNDIGCGVMTVEVGVLDKDFDFERMDRIIHENIPTNHLVRDEPIHGFKKKLKELKCYDHLQNTGRIERALGTLGGGKTVASFYGDVSK